MKRWAFGVAFGLALVVAVLELAVWTTATAHDAVDDLRFV